jgi:hypothetical protein
MEAKHEQSAYTLDILSKYCGFTSFDNFIKSVAASNDHQPKHQNDELLFYLVTLFKNTEVKDANDFTFYKLVRHTITFLESHPSLIDELQCEIAKTSNGQTFYFEQFINIDRLNGHYGNGLRYYLNEKRTLDAQLFGNYHLCLKYWLTLDNTELKKRYNDILSFDISQKMTAASAAYFFASQILYAHAADANADSILVKARHYYTAFDAAKENQYSAIRFYYTMSQTLILTEQYEEALFYIDDFMKYIKKHPLNHSDNGILYNLYLLKSIAVYYCIDKSLARQIFETINPFNFFFLSREFMTILYLSLKQGFKKSAIEQSHINHLIKKTGFSRLLAEKEVAGLISYCSN